MLGLPDDVQALLFDLDGVLTETAVVHTRAWKEMFDAYLQQRAASDHAEFVPFSEADYLDYVDGRPRPDGVRSFLASRAITLPEGNADDGGDVETVNGLGARKNALVLEILDRDGVDQYADAVTYLDAVATTGMRSAVVSSSANCRRVLEITGLLDRFELVVDGNVIVEQGLRGKPAPDSFLYAAETLGARANQAAVFEDAIAGVESGRDGRFGCVVGVARGGPASERALAAAGADRVVTALTELL